MDSINNFQLALMRRNHSHKIHHIALELETHHSDKRGNYRFLNCNLSHCRKTPRLFPHDRNIQIPLPSPIGNRPRQNHRKKDHSYSCLYLSHFLLKTLHPYSNNACNHSALIIDLQTIPLQTTCCSVRDCSYLIQNSHSLDQETNQVAPHPGQPTSGA